MAVTTPGILYIGHLSVPFGPRGAQHYVGWTENVDARWADHLSGQGSRFIRGALQAGIGVTLYVLGPGTPGDERDLKRRKANWRPLCPTCRRPADSTHRLVRLFARLTGGAS